MVPREGVTPGGQGGGSYGSRELRDVEFVDYNRPGYMVVHTEGTPPKGDALRLRIREARRGVELVPKHGVVAVGGKIVVHNEADAGILLSDPVAGVMVRVGAGETLEIDAGNVVTHDLHLLGHDGEQTTVFVSPGPYSVPSDTGRFELANLEPGPTTFRTWHPRFPSMQQSVELRADEVTRVDLKVGVANLESTSHADH